MARSAGSGRLWLAVALSPLVHLAGAAAVVSGLADRSESEQNSAALSLLPPSTPQPPEKERVTLGIERSNAATITWIGFETPTEHAAMKGDVEQPALSRDVPSPPPQPPEPLAREAASPDPHPAATEPVQEPAHSDPADPAPPQPQPIQPTDRPQPNPTPTPLELAQRAADTLRPLVEALREQLTLTPAPAQQVPRDHPAPDPTPPTPPSPPYPQQPAAPSPPAPAVADAAPPPPAAELRPSTEKTQKEVSPFSLDKPLVVRPGRPAAAEGLEVQTDFLERYMSLHVRATVGRDRIKVLATFNRQGRVTSVEFVERARQGRAVDEAVKDCVFNWRAKGRAIDSLPANDPSAGVVIPFEIVIR